MGTEIEDFQAGVTRLVNECGKRAFVLSAPWLKSYVDDVREEISPQTSRKREYVPYQDIVVGMRIYITVKRKGWARGWHVVTGATPNYIMTERAEDFGGQETRWHMSDYCRVWYPQAVEPARYATEVVVSF